MCGLLLVCLWHSYCSFTVLGLLSKKGGGDWRIMSSHFVLGEVSTGLWKDGFHLSPRWLWRMATCVASVTAQGLCFLVLSETYSCPNEEQTSGLFHPLTPCLHATKVGAKVFVLRSISNTVRTSLSEMMYYFMTIKLFILLKHHFYGLCSLFKCVH